MKAVKGKWKALLLLNYLCSVIWLLALFAYYWMHYRAGQGGPEIKSNTTSIAVGAFSLFLCNCLFIYVIQTHLPARNLSKRVMILYAGALIIEGLVTLFLFFVFALGILAVLSNDKDAFKDIFISLFLFVLLIVYVLRFIWQVQLMKSLERNAENELKSVLNSIGTDENNNVE